MIITKKEVYWIILIVIIAFLVRILFFSLHNTVELDGAYYISLGKNLIENGLYRDLENNLNTNLTPGMPIAIGLVNLIFKDGVLSARLVSAIFGALLIIPVYLFTKRIYSRKEAIISAILTMAYTVFIYTSTLTYNDSFYLFLFVSGLYFGWLSLIKEKIWMYLITGLIFGAASLVRPEGILLPFVLIFYCLILFRKYSLKNFTNLMILLAIFLLVLSPWLLFVYENTGKIQISTKGGFTYLQREFEIFTDNYEKNLFSLNQDKTRIRLNPYNQTIDSSTSAYILKEPLDFLERYLINFKDLIFKFLVSIFPVIFLLISIYGFADRKDRKIEHYLLLFILYPVFMYPVFGSEGRWLLSAVPILLIWLSRGLTRLEEWRKIFNAKLITIILAVLMLVSVSFVNDFVPKIYEKDDQPVEHKLAGEWFKKNIGDGKAIMERRPWISFYSNGRFVYLPYASYNDTIKYACNNKVEYFVADSRYLGRLRQQLSFMLNKDFNDLGLVYENEANGKTVKIYKVKC